MKKETSFKDYLRTQPSNAVCVLLALVFLTLMAQLALPVPSSLGGVPITGQSLAVLLIGLLLPSPYGGLTVFLYLLLGALGLPVFAQAKGGWEVLVGGSGGFLLGFLPAALLMGWLRGRGWGQRLSSSLLAHSLGTVLILGSGCLWLSILYSPGQALAYGFYPFWPGAVVKVLIGSIITWLWLRRSR